jgi:ABC-2 type transport system ATP-binding protein
MNEIVIKTDALTRNYESYLKEEGIWNSFKGLVKRRHITKHALRPTDFTVRRGEVIGLVGANGAGKTTLIKILSGLIHPSSGSAKVLGFEPWKRDYQLLRRVSVLLGQKAQLWWDIPPIDSFALLGKIYDIPKNVLKQRIDELTEVLQVGDQLNTQLRRLSLGERMKMEFLGALLHRPEVIFLDEPTIGLDIVAQASIRKFLNGYVQRENPTIILTSHYMDDIAGMATRLMLMSHGSIVYDGTVNEFKQKSSNQQKLSFRIVTPPSQDLSVANKWSIKKGDDTFTGEFEQEEIGSFLSSALQQVQVTDLSIEQSDFEDVIHKFLEKESRVRGTRHP